MDREVAVAGPVLPAGSARLGSWVLLSYRLPREPSNPRVGVWRKLERLGVARLGDGLVALPADARTREQLDWLAEEILEAGGVATVWLATPASAAQERAIAQAMRDARAAEYQAVAAQARAAAGGGAVERTRVVRRLRGELRRPAARSSGARGRAMRWATRAGVHIDRAACAWLIRRHLDSEASFVFVDDPAEVPAEATAFDMRGVELGHRGGDCSFETILRRYGMEDPVLWKLAELVHEADLDDERFDAPEARGLDVVLRGLSMTLDDARVLEVSGPLFDGLYEYYRRGLLLGREPA